jgi:hypothetical protein
MFEYIDSVSDAGGLSARQRTSLQSRVAAVLDGQRLLNSGHYRRSAITPMDQYSGRGGLAIGGLGAVYKAVWNWVRGLHAFCYGRCADEGLPHAVYVDFPVFRGVEEPHPVESANVVRKAREILLALPKAAVDGVDFWDGTCRYRCAWLVSDAIGRCLWWLCLPGRGRAREYAGWYDDPPPPPGCAELG